jgi:serine/threonine-protein kinase
MIGDRYEVESVIGKGTFGPIYKARDIATGKVLCLKMVSTPISRHRRIVKRIMQEVEKAKTLNHPHIVPIYDSSIDKSGRPFYVMDLIEPGSLKHVIKQEGFLDVPEVIDIFLDVCEALSYAHEHGILHRDLKPGNILLSGHGTARRAKVCDFGIIKALPSVGSEAQEMTQSTDVFADPSCMSPEQCLGRRLDIRSDIYSLGCSMYEAIIGKKVFTGPNALSVVVQHFKATPRPFDAVMYNCDISPDVEAVVLKMLEKAPEHRYQEISQVMEDLRLLKSHRKPSFAYQKKKSGGLNLMLPFSNQIQRNECLTLF